MRFLPSGWVRRCCCHCFVAALVFGLERKLSLVLYLLALFYEWSWNIPESSCTHRGYLMIENVLYNSSNSEFEDHRGAVATASLKPKWRVATVMILSWRCHQGHAYDSFYFLNRVDCTGTQVDRKPAGYTCGFQVPAIYNLQVHFSRLKTENLQVRYLYLRVWTRDIHYPQGLWPTK